MKCTFCKKEKKSLHFLYNVFEPFGIRLPQLIQFWLRKRNLDLYLCDACLKEHGERV